MSDAPKRGAGAVRAAGKRAKEAPRLVVDNTGGGSGGPPASGADGPLIVDLRDGPAMARQVLAARFEVRGVRTLHFHSDRWLHWNGATCRQIDDIKVEKATKEVLERAHCRDREGVPVRVKLSERVLSSTIKFMRIEAENDAVLPCWLPAMDPADDEGLPAVDDVFVCANRLIDLRQGLPFPPHPRFLSLNASPAMWDDHAECPQWLAFLEEIFSNKEGTAPKHEVEEQVGTLQRWLGYVLMPSAHLQRALLIVGLTRSGKGTIGLICRALVGARNSEGPSLSSLAERFGLTPLIDKQLAVIDEATIGPKVDRGEIGSIIRKWIGQDIFTIDQKHGAAWTGPLRAKLMIVSNELPTFSDAVAALAARFIVLQTQRSFVDDEDPTLEPRLMEELPGILRWAVEGARLLIEEGKLKRPAATSQMHMRFKDQMADVSTFVKHECKVGSGSTTKDDLYQHFESWSKGIGFEKTMPKNVFGRKLLDTFPTVREIRLPKNSNNQRPWAYENIRLVPQGTSQGELLEGKT